MDVVELSVFLGTNGSGKSSVLYALNWFFNGGIITESDVHKPPQTELNLLQVDLPEQIEVSVVFNGLNSHDREKLGQYGRGSQASFKKIWNRLDNKEKIVGNSLQGPGFQAIRNLKKVTEFRPAYTELQSRLRDLQVLTGTFSGEEVNGALIAWESNSANYSSLEEIDEADANHLFGINGPNVMGELVKLVLIPASVDILSEVGSAKKGSTLEDLVGTLISTAGITARDNWVQKHVSDLEDLRKNVVQEVDKVTQLQSTRISKRLSKFIPGAEVHFVSEVPPWSPNVNPSIKTEVSISGSTVDISRQGHGLQRAVLMATFQALTHDEMDIQQTHVLRDGESVEQGQIRLSQELTNLPLTIICFEEPEIYQHPIRARALARLLAELVIDPSIQILVATHSPYFVRPQDFHRLKKFRLNCGETEVKFTSIKKVALASGVAATNIVKFVEKHLSRSFSESFFADAVVLVEGETDRIIIESLSDLLGMNLDIKGISVVDVSSKETLRTAYAILESLDIRTFVVVDGDALGAKRKHAGEQAKIDEATANHRKSTETIISWLPSSAAIVGTFPYNFDDPSSIFHDYVFWHDDIETELDSWESFKVALKDNGGKLRKDKDLAKYKAGVMDADHADMPESLKILIETIYGLA